jgi:hypothetical protein
MRPVLALFLIAAPLAAQHGGAPKPMVPLTPATMRADLTVMREQFVMKDAAFTPETRQAALARIARLENAADTLHRPYFELEIARIAALADNGHSNSPGVMRSYRFNRAGIRLTPFGQDFYVLGVQSAFADLLGAKLVSIDGHPASQLRDIGRTLTGGTTGWRDRYVSYFLESPEQMHALGAINNADAATYGFELADGRKLQRRIVADAPDTIPSFAPASRWMSGTPFTNDGKQWKTMFTEQSAPWAQREWGNRFRWREAPEIDGVVVELRQNVDAGPQSILVFLDSMERMLTKRKPVNVVLDMRLNGGGNLNTTRNFVQKLPSLASGRLFVLTSPYTFSAAISTVGYLKQAAPERVSIVGEEIGDRLQFFAEGRPIDLPNSGVGIGVTTERHDYKTGCKPFSDCHGAVVRNPISVPTLSPDIAAPWTIQAFRAGRDPGMEAVQSALGRR